MSLEAITLKPVADKPDSDATVLLFDPAASEPVWLGYLDGGSVPGQTRIGRRTWSACRVRKKSWSARRHRLTQKTVNKTTKRVA
jgi:hypothetical protein